jgi:predicted mannosyl-3-phosphoglycerate phosphatase (HAD superfamily)
VNQLRTATQPSPSHREHARAVERTNVALAARLTWKDQHGATRFASVTARNISEMGVYIESQTPLTLPMYRLVQFQLERDDRMVAQVPRALRDVRLLSAVYRVVPPAASRPQGFALRLLIDPKRLVAEEATPRRATA